MNNWIIFYVLMALLVSAVTVSGLIAIDYGYKHQGKNCEKAGGLVDYTGGFLGERRCYIEEQGNFVEVKPRLINDEWRLVR